jgi:hypothetical protein
LIRRIVPSSQEGPVISSYSMGTVEDLLAFIAPDG